MTTESMTGFGTSSGSISLSAGVQVTWCWELKSVNGRGLDLRVKLPSGYDRLDPVLRELAKPLLRGSINGALTISVHGQKTGVVIDSEMLRSVGAAADQISKSIECGPPTVDGFLALKGILVPADDQLSDDENQQVFDAVVAGFGDAVSALGATRRTEGARMHGVLSEQLSRLESDAAMARTCASDVVKTYHETILVKMKNLLADTTIAEDRLMQEAALLAAKSDIREELDRLDGHIVAARSYLSDGGAIGRPLDFIAQELMREANTLTVKVPSLEMKQIGLSMKGIVDQFKEQVQNIA